MGIFRNDPQPVQLTPHVPAAALTTGSQPPRTAVAGALAMACVLVSWPALGEPHPIQPMQGRSQIAPLTLVYGQQPPRIDPVPRVQGRTVIASWPDDKEPRLQFSDQQPERRYVAPLTLVYGSQPPLVGPLTPLELAISTRSWDPPRLEPPPLVKAAPLTLVYGDSPPNVAPLSATITGMARLAWEPPRPEPPPPVKLAPLTLVYGDQPLSDAKRVARHVAWRAWEIPPVSPQQPTGTAAWNVPVILSTVPFFRPPVSWPALDWSAQRAGQIVPLTLAYGQAPPVNGAITPAELNEFVRAWDFTWGAQSQSPNAGWNIPAIISQPIPFSVQCHIVRFSWEPLFVYPASAADVAAFANVVPTLDRAIAQSDGTDSIISATSSATGTFTQNSGIIAIVASDSQIIALITGNSGTSSIDSDE